MYSVGLNNMDNISYLSIHDGYLNIDTIWLWFQRKLSILKKVIKQHYNTKGYGTCSFIEQTRSVTISDCSAAALLSLTVFCIYFEWTVEERQGGAERVRWENDMQQRGCWVELNPGQLQQACSTTLYDVHGSVNIRGSIERFSDRALPTAASDSV